MLGPNDPLLRQPPEFYKAETEYRIRRAKFLRSINLWEEGRAAKDDS